MTETSHQVQIKLTNFLFKRQWSSYPHYEVINQLLGHTCKGSSLFLILFLENTKFKIFFGLPNQFLLERYFVYTLFSSKRFKLYLEIDNVLYERNIFEKLITVEYLNHGLIYKTVTKTRNYNR